MIDRFVDRWLDTDSELLDRSLAELHRKAPRVASWVASLLAASRQPTSYLQTLFQRAGQAVADDARAAEVRLPTGTRLGPWRLIEHVGQGGMGAVYRAERADGAFVMQAAIKLIRLERPGLNERLESERRLLARLDHRHIARLIDGGANDDGLAYLVMEWVGGQDLDKFMQRARPGLSVRLDLFEQISEAVAHAHQRRVVHGDLKPTNVRVTESGQARLLDFGVARMVEEDAGTMVDPGLGLTPAYSAPEQLAGQPPTTLSDVWSLGTLLLWLLSEAPEEDSTARPELDRLPPDLARRADLAAIIARARAQQPEDRYEGAAQLLEDVQRYRHCQAIKARRTTRRYITARFVQRHRLATFAGLVVTLAIGLALVGMVWQAHQATLERNLAQTERDRAQTEAEKTRQVSDFVVDLFRQANPGNHQGEELMASDLARIGAERLETIDASPEVQADFLLVLSRVEQALGNYPQAVTLAERAIELRTSAHGPVNIELARLHSQLGASLVDAGNFEAGALAHRQALNLLGTSDPRLRAEIQTSLGISLRRQGRFEDAIETLEQALDYWISAEPSGASEATTRNNLAIPLFRTGQTERSIEMLTAALAAYRNSVGPDHPLTATALGNLGAAHLNSGKLDEAEGYLHQSLELRQQLFGPDHPKVANSYHALGRVALDRGDLEAAETWLGEATEIRSRTLGEDHFALAPGLLNLAIIAIRLDRLDLAQAHIDRARPIYLQSHPADHPVFAQLKHVKGDLAMAHDKATEAAAWHEEALIIRRQGLGEEHRATISSMIRLATAYRDGGSFDDASRWAEQAEQLIIKAGDEPESDRLTRIAELQASLH